MTESIVPAAVKLAAKRGFVRTTTQALAATLTTGVSAAAVLRVVTGETEIVPTVITLAVALVSPFIAGLASYLTITSQGIPGEYKDATLTELAEKPVTEQDVDVADAVSRTLRRDLRE